MIANSLDLYQNQLNQMESTLATGQNISMPSENPAGTVDLLGANTSLSTYNNYSANIKVGQTVASLANQSLSQAVDLVQKMREVLIQAGAPGVTATNAQGLASQLAGLEQSLLGVANTTYQGLAIFGGTSGVGQAYTQPGGPGTAVTYQGNQQTSSVQAAPGISLDTSIPDPFGASTASGGIFSAINQAITDLNNGNISAVTSTDLANLTTQLNALTNQSATAGINYQQFQLISNQVESAVTQITAEVSSIQNVDYAKLTTSYQQALSNYQVALYAASKVAQPTLASYLS
jgi:flagellar hook-associated protein 3 FlgL